MKYFVFLLALIIANYHLFLFMLWYDVCSNITVLTHKSGNKKNPEAF